MAEVDAKPRASAQVGCVAGVALLLFAGALVATAQFGVEASSHARRLYVDDSPVVSSQVAASPVVSLQVAASPLASTTPAIAAVGAAPFTGVAAAPVAGEVVAPAATLTAKAAVPILNCEEKAYLSVQADAASPSITVRKSHAFIVGQRLAIGVGTANQEEHYIAAAGPGTVMTLRKPLVYTHIAGAQVCIQKLTLHEQFKHQFSTGSLGSLTSVDSSTGSSSKSSDSMTSLQFGSSADNLPKATAASSGAGFGGGWFFNFIIMLCYACCYKSKVVDPVGVMQPQSQQHDLDDFPVGICECLKDINMCCMVTCCPFVRMAHTNAVTNVCGFWNTLICLGCATLLPMGPCCLQVYFRIHIKDHMGIQDHCFNDLVCAACCLPCITGQQALSADSVMGVQFKLPCSLAPKSFGGYGGYGNPEQQQFSYS